MPNSEFEYSKIAPSEEQLKLLSKGGDLIQADRARSYRSFWTYNPEWKTIKESDLSGSYISLEASYPVQIQKKRKASDLNLSEEDIVEKGWKLHVGIYDSDIDNLAKAWSIVKDIIITYKIAHSKVIAPNYFLRLQANDPTIQGLCEGPLAEQNPAQRAKQITIYCDDNPELSKSDWKRIATEITVKLAEQQVIPAPRERVGERMLLGSNYVSYRNELDEKGEYANISEATNKYMPETVNDLFGGYSVTIEIPQPIYHTALERRLIEENRELKDKLATANELNAKLKSELAIHQQNSVQSELKVSSPEEGSSHFQSADSSAEPSDPVRSSRSSGMRNK